MLRKKPRVEKTRSIGKMMKTRGVKRQPKTCSRAGLLWKREMLKLG